jgi:predicted Zn-dependent protease
VNQLARLLLDGKSSADAVPEVFGGVDVLEAAYLEYERKPILQYSRLKVATNTSSTTFSLKALGAVDSILVRAAVHASEDRITDARALITDARRSAPEAPVGYDLEAMLLDAEGKGEEASAALAKAACLKSDNFYTYYRLAALTWRSNLDADERTRIEALLRRSVALNDSYAFSYALLAEVLARDAQSPDALEAANKAVSLEPGSFSIRLSLARVLWALSRRDSARAIALSARALARTDDQLQQAQALLAFFNGAPAH